MKSHIHPQHTYSSQSFHDLSNEFVMYLSVVLEHHSKEILMSKSLSLQIKSLFSPLPRTSSHFGSHVDRSQCVCFVIPKCLLREL